MDNQLSLFGATAKLPEGFKYEPDVIPADVEQSILAHVRELPLREFQFKGFTGKRRTISFGWRYDFSSESLHKTDDIPAFLLSLRNVAAGFAELAPAQLQQVLVSEYDAGAGIGWHRDKFVFGDVVGISLLRGPSRTEWEHSIPPVEALRYSITFRNLRET